MGHEQKLLRGVESDERSDAPAPGEEPIEAVVAEDPLDEVLAQPRIAEAPLLLDRQVRQLLHQGRGEEAGLAATGHALVRVHADPLPCRSSESPS